MQQRELIAGSSAIFSHSSSSQTRRVYRTRTRLELLILDEKEAYLQNEVAPVEHNHLPLPTLDQGFNTRQEAHNGRRRNRGTLFHPWPVFKAHQRMFHLFATIALHDLQRSTVSTVS